LARQLVYQPLSTLHSKCLRQVSEDVETVTDLIQESMKTKLALCIVSKSFHEIAIEFLYEIVTLRRL
jgi:hypothetical protein